MIPGGMGTLQAEKLGPLRVGGLGRLDDGSGGACKGHGGHAAGLAGDQRLRVTGGLLGDAAEEQRDPANEDMRADAGLDWWNTGRRMWVANTSGKPRSAPGGSCRPARSRRASCADRTLRAATGRPLLLGRDGGPTGDQPPDGGLAQSPLDRDVIAQGAFGAGVAGEFPRTSR